MAKLTSAAQLFDIKDEVFKEVEVPEWVIDGEPVTVTLKALSGIDRDQFESSAVSINPRTGKPEPNVANLRARLLALCIVNDDGVPIFKGDANALKLGMKSAKAIDRLFTIAAELSGVDLMGVKSQAEDFGDDQSDSSTTD